MDVNKPYVVVKFIEDGTFSEIPTAWLKNETTCWWPRQKNLSNLIAKSVTPDEESWSTFQILIVKYCCKWNYKT